MLVSSRHDHQDLVYYNAALFNPASGQPIPASVSDTRGAAIIESPELWQCSVVRFDISASLLPPIVLPMPGPPAVGSVPSNLVVTLRHLGIDYQAVVSVFSASPLTYGFMYSGDELMTRLNQALATAFAAIPGPSSSEPPVFVFNPVTQLITLYFQSTYATAADPVEIYLNSAAYQYVLSLPAGFLGYNTPSGRDFLIQPGASSVVTLPALGSRAGYPTLVQAVAGEVRALTQAGPSTGAWNGVRSIVITTSLPVNSENLPGSSLVSQNTSYSNNNLPILSDFILGGEPSENPISDRIQVTYLPTAEYRMVQLRGREPLKRLDLKWFYSLYDGTLRELLLPPGGHASAKILFRRNEQLG